MNTPKHEAGPLLQKSFAFAVRMMKFYRHLQANEREYVVSKQLLRSATSIGANAEEATGAISAADFTSKISIAYQGSPGDKLLATFAARRHLPGGKIVFVAARRLPATLPDSLLNFALKRTGQQLTVRSTLLNVRHLFLKSCFK